MKRKVSLGIVFLLAVLIIAGINLYYGYNQFKIQENFTSIPLTFDPSNSSSTYNWNGAVVKIKGGFVKGKVIADNVENLVLRSLSPVPVITVQGSPDAEKAYYLRIENVNPVNVKLSSSKIDRQQVIDPHTLLLVLKLKRNEVRTVQLAPNLKAEFAEFVILGDNRNGYQTFAQIIDQINAINPVFVIDNGDLVFGGEPNKYRLFYQTVSKLRVPIYTSIGNHDVRENGRPLYTKLFGPAYYSFDYGGDHFAILDSSRGWTEKRAIPEEQYRWLEKDLSSAAGKRIFVITHIPPVDPRGDIKENQFPGEPGIAKTSYFEQIMNDYSQYKSTDHGFSDKQEALRFEQLMTKYQVDTVFLSHIHSYYSYLKGGVRYLISGGAGAELLTTNSYYHYLRVKITTKENFIEMVELPSPTNNIQDRYLAAISLFANSIYQEYQTTVFLTTGLLAVGIFWLLYSTYQTWWSFLKFIGAWLWEVIQFAIKSYRERKY